MGQSECEGALDQPELIRPPVPCSGSSRSYRFPRLSERGSAVVEVVIVLPMMMLVILLSVQAAVWAEAAEVVQAAAAVGSETAAGAGGSSASGAAATASYLAIHGGHLVTGPSVQVGNVPGGLVQVRVNGSAISIIPFLHLNVSAVRVEPVQEFRESG
jgi:Flp pilus assembly protein TadG